LIEMIGAANQGLSVGSIGVRRDRRVGQLVRLEVQRPLHEVA
jgi:hypothetical protein